MPSESGPDFHPLTPQQSALLADVASAVFALRFYPLSRMELLEKTLVVRESIQRLRGELEVARPMEIGDDDGEVN